MSSYYGDVVHRAGAPLHDHIGELGHLYLGVLPLLHQVHDGQRGALGRRAPPLPVAVVALGLLAAPRAPEGLVAGRFDDPVLGPGEGAEVDEVLLPAAGVLVLGAITARTNEGGRKKEGGIRSLEQRGPECLSYAPACQKRTKEAIFFFFLNFFWFLVAKLLHFSKP